MLLMARRVGYQGPHPANLIHSVTVTGLTLKRQLRGLKLKAPGLCP